jgi:hypothetical protein
VPAGASPNAQTFALPEGNQGVIGKNCRFAVMRVRPLKLAIVAPFLSRANCSPRFGIPCTPLAALGRVAPTARRAQCLLLLVGESALAKKGATGKSKGTETQEKHLSS